MQRLRKNDGFTLVELMVTILVATIVTLSATTVLLLSIRVMNKSTKTAERQYNTRVLLTALEDMAAEGTITEAVTVTDAQNNTGWRVYDRDKVIFSYDGTKDAVYVGEPDDDVPPLVDDIEASTVSLAGNILHLIVKHTGEEPYELSVYCRLLSEDNAGDNTATELIEALNEEEYTLSNEVPHYLGRTAFLKVLASQYGSRGEIIGGDGTWRYYSEWYIDGYEEHSGWNANTPWCACYISWALAQSDLRSYFGSSIPCAAHVDDPDPENDDGVPYFRQSFSGDSWLVSGATPQAGDLIFFNTDGDPQADHMGAVLAVQEYAGVKYVYTIEGNVYNKVSTRRYTLNDPSILGYGVLPWR